METQFTDFLFYSGITLFLFWVYKSIVNIDEGWHINIKLFGRYDYSISGVREEVFDENNKLVPGVNKRKFEFIFYGIQKVSRYKFYWIESRPSSDVTPGDPNIIWGDPTLDAEVSYLRHEWTSRHKDQHDYRFRINGQETGDKITSGGNSKTPENVKVDSSLVATVKMVSPADAEFRSDADWYKSLVATMTGALAEIISSMTYADLPLIRGEKIADYPVKNTNQEKEGDTMTFLERINYEMLEDKRLGVKLINVTLLDFIPDKDSAPYVAALQKKSVSIINLETATNDADALDKFLQKKKEYVKDLIQADKEARIDVKKTEDITIVKKFEQLKGVKFLVESGSGSGTSAPPFDVNQIVNTTLSLEASEEIKNSEATGDKKIKKGGHK